MALQASNESVGTVEDSKSINGFSPSASLMRSVHSPSSAKIANCFLKTDELIDYCFTLVDGVSTQNSGSFFLRCGVVCVELFNHLTDSVLCLNKRFSIFLCKASPSLVRYSI